MKKQLVLAAAELEERSHRFQRPLLVGISGIDASGKGYIASALAHLLTNREVPVTVVPLDPFHNPPEVRFAAKNRAKHFYEYAFDFNRVFAALAAIRQRAGASVILVEGIFLFKNPQKQEFDYRIWVDCTFQTALERALERNQEHLSNEALVADYRQVYHLAQRQHLSIDQPRQGADAIIVNDPRLEKGPEVLLPSLGTGSVLAPGLQWRNAPADWRIEAGQLHVAPDPRTDFWQRTHYGFENDNGHFLYLETAADFRMETHVSWTPKHQFDQAGLMVRIDQDNWLKTAIEYQLEDPAGLGAVATNYGYSDWSIQPVSATLRTCSLRVERQGCDFTIDVKLPDCEWHRIRVARLHLATGVVCCGLFIASPIDGGYRAEFASLRIEELLY